MNGIGASALLAGIGGVGWMFCLSQWSYYASGREPLVLRVFMWATPSLTLPLLGRLFVMAVLS